MAPEMMLADVARISARSDVYLLGGILYEIFSGRPPHHGDTLEAMMASALLSEPAFPHALAGSVDEICEQLERRRAEYGFSYITVGAAVADDFAPVVARMAGR